MFVGAHVLLHALAAHTKGRRQHVFLMSQYRSAFQIKIMGSRTRVNEREQGLKYGIYRGGAFLRADVGGELKNISGCSEGVHGG